MKTNLPNRKHPRLDEYDYSAAGAYFVTICTQDRRCVFSRFGTKSESGMEYTEYGMIAAEQLSLLEKRFPSLSVDQYVIMPNHIHAIFLLNSGAAGADSPPYGCGEKPAAGVNPRPTVMDMICAYKSLTAKACRAHGFSGKLFQTSFYEHVIRGREDYEQIVKYIADNPTGWYLDELYADS